jgi:DNA-binding CsgD family transcriptional regulator
VVILTTFGRSGYLRRAMESGAVGFLLKDAPAAGLAVAIRRIIAGERVVDPEFALAALSEGHNPLTSRERDALAASLDGASIADIAARLSLSEGTVRNHLSIAIQKLGAHNRMEAARRFSAERCHERVVVRVRNKREVSTHISAHKGRGGFRSATNEFGTFLEVWGKGNLAVIDELTEPALPTWLHNFILCCITPLALFDVFSYATKSKCPPKTGMEPTPRCVEQDRWHFDACYRADSCADLARWRGSCPDRWAAPSRSTAAQHEGGMITRQSQI